MKTEYMNWRELSIKSHYQTAIAVQHELEQGDIEEAKAGIEELADALSRSEKRALRSQLTRLMMHIIKWKIQPQYRSRSWLSTISNARFEIASLLEDEPSLKPGVFELWDKCFNAAKGIARDETGIPPLVDKLSWEEVFEEEYCL